MGILDFVKTGVMRSRSRDRRRQVFWSTNLDPTILMFAQPSCTPTGRTFTATASSSADVGGPAHPRLQNIPFLSPLLDRLTGGDVLRAEVFFVLTPWSAT
jgi:hypothetical protein